MKYLSSMFRMAAKFEHIFHVLTKNFSSQCERHSTKHGLDPGLDPKLDPKLDSKLDPKLDSKLDPKLDSKNINFS